MADEQQPPPPPPPKPVQPVAQQPVQQPAQQPAINFAPSGLVNPFNPNPGIIAEAGQRGISAGRFADAAGPITPRGTGYSYMTGRGSKVDVAGTPDKPKPRPAPPPPPDGGSGDYTGEEYF